MKLRNRASDRLVIAIVNFLAGILLVTTGFKAFMNAAGQDSGVTRFLLGYTFLWCGVTMWIQHLNAKALMGMANSLVKNAGDAQPNPGESQG